MSVMLEHGLKKTWEVLMANSQREKKQSLDTFHAWVLTQSNGDFKLIIYREN